MSRTARALTLLFVLPLVIVACGGDDDDGGGAAENGACPAPCEVEADDNKFVPEEITIGAGEAVTWRFVGGNAHNVTFDDFHSDLVKEGEYEQAFNEAGEYDYVCTVHPGMEGTVVVEEAASDG